MLKACIILAGTLGMYPAFAQEIPHETYELSNGLRVILAPDRTVPKVVVDVWYDVGSYDDPDGRSGFAHLFEHLMFKGTSRVKEGQFDAFMEQAGGWNNATTSDERTNYFDVAPSSALDLLLWLEADRMTSLDVTQSKLDVEREVVRNERRQNYEDRPYGQVWIALSKALYPSSNRLSRNGIGDHEQLMASSLEDVRSFYETYYGPNNAVLTVAGDFDSEELKPRIEELFGRLPTRPIPERVGPNITGKPAKHQVDLEDDVTLPMLMFVWHGPRAYAAGDAERDVLAHLLAGSDGGRLSKRLLIDEQLVQDVSVFQYSNRWDSQFFVSVMANPDADLGAVERSVMEEIAALAAERRPQAGELKRAVANIEMDLLYGVESSMGRAEALQRYQMYAGDSSYMDEDIARYRALSPEVLTSEAAKLTPESCVRLRVLPKGAE